MKNLRASDLQKFISLIKDEEEPLRYKQDVHLVLFRGQPCDEPLLPKIARDLKWIKEFSLSPRIKGRQLEQYMLNEFKRRASPYLAQKPENDWDWLIHAQHHGLETRLLDWTENPLVALYFALLNSKFEDRSEGVVWLLKIKSDEAVVSRKGSNPFVQKNTVVFRPNFVSRRLEAQSGWFSLHRYLEIRDHFVPLERNKDFKDRLVKITVPRRHASSILEDLSLCGINAATLFPDLDGISKFINWKKGSVRYAKIEMPRAISNSKK